MSQNNHPFQLFIEMFYINENVFCQNKVFPGGHNETYILSHIYGKEFDFSHGNLFLRDHGSCSCC